MSDNTLLERLRAAGTAEAGPARREEVPQRQTGESEGHDASDRAGMVARHAQFGLTLVWPDGNSETVLYGGIVSTVLYNPSLGITFVFEALREVRVDCWEHGLWQVSIKGNNLETLRNHLGAGRRESIRVNGTTVTEIAIRALPNQEQRTDSDA